MGMLLIRYVLSPHPAVAADEGEGLSSLLEKQVCQDMLMGSTKAVHQLSVKFMSRDESHLTTHQTLQLIHSLPILV